MDDEVTGAPGGNAGYDQAQMARLARMALRGRSIRSAAREMEISESILSKLIHKRTKSRPTVTTLRKMSAGSPPELLRKMLEVCKYPRDMQEEMDDYVRMVREAPDFEDVRPIKTAWSVSRALALVLEILTSRKYGSRFEIDYCADGMFTLDVAEEYPLLCCIPVILPKPDLRPDAVLQLVLEKVREGIERWGVEDTAIMILTDSPSVYQLLRYLPNRSKIMAAALVSGDSSGIDRQYTILPLEPMTDSVEKFPMDLSMSGDELMTDI